MDPYLSHKTIREANQPINVFPGYFLPIPKDEKQIIIQHAASFEILFGKDTIYFQPIFSKMFSLCLGPTFPIYEKPLNSFFFSTKGEIFLFLYSQQDSFFIKYLKIHLDQTCCPASSIFYIDNLRLLIASCSNGGLSLFQFPENFISVTRNQDTGFYYISVTNPELIFCGETTKVVQNAFLIQNKYLVRHEFPNSIVVY